MLLSPLRIVIRWCRLSRLLSGIQQCQGKQSDPCPRPGFGRVPSLPHPWVSCSVDTAHFTIYTIQVGTEVRGNIFHGATHGKWHRYHKLQSWHLPRRLRISLYTDLQRNIYSSTACSIPSLKDLCSHLIVDPELHVMNYDSWAHSGYSPACCSQLPNSCSRFQTKLVHRLGP